MDFPEKYPDSLKTLVQSLVGSMERDGVDPKEAQRYAFSAVEDYRLMHGGDTPYIAKGLAFETYEKWTAMFNDFKSGNYDELAAKYDIVPRHCRRIIAAMKVNERKKRQGTLAL